MSNLLDHALGRVIESIRERNEAGDRRAIRGVEIWVSADGRIDLRTETSRGYHERTVRCELPGVDEALRALLRQGEVKDG